LIANKVLACFSSKSCPKVLHAGVAGKLSLHVAVADVFGEKLQKHMSDFVREKRHLLAEFTVTGLLVEVMKAVV